MIVRKRFGRRARSENRAAIKLQAWGRGRAQRTAFVADLAEVHDNAAATRLQAAVRGRAARVSYSKERSAALLVETRVRGFTCTPVSPRTCELSALNVWL